MASPILDLSYRTYDGPLEPPVARWWPIAKMSMRLAIKKKGFWIWASISGYWYAVLVAVFYFTSLQPPQAIDAFFSRINWKDEFLSGFSLSQLMLFLITLLIGVGSIANDNRANALLVYLSKPCTKLDYLIGKWVGIFLPITAVCAVPTLVFYSYCALSYSSHGFMADHALILRLLAMVLVPGFVHASLALGVSSLFNQGRIAGGVYAGLYFFTLLFTGMLTIPYHQLQPGSTGAHIARNLFYCSVDGVQIGMAKALLGTSGSGLLPGARDIQMPAPDFSFVAMVMLGACALSLAVAWHKVRAVEVVG